LIPNTVIRQQDIAIYRFDGFEIDRANRQFLREGEPVSLAAKAFDLLVTLVENRGRLVEKDELFENVWHGQIVEESNLTVYISQIRKALGESRKEPKYIETIPGYGYRFIGELEEDDDDEYVIETQTLSRITVENYEDEVRANALDVTTLDTSLERRQLTGRKPRRFLYYSAAAIGAVIVLIVGSYYLLNRLEAANAESSATQRSRFLDANIKRLTNKGNINWAVMSPDGKFFAYTTNTERDDFKLALLLAQTDGSNEIQVRPPESGIYRGLAFSHDSKTLYFSVNSRDQSNFGTLYRMPVLGGVPEKLLENVGGFVSLSPDDRQVAFFRKNKQAETSTLIIANTDGSGEREAASRPMGSAFSSYAAAWSPDGSMLAVGAIDEAKNREIFVVKINDGSIKQLTNFGWHEVVNIAWLGQDLVAIAKAKGSANNQIWQIDTATGNVERISRDTDTYGSPISVSSDSKMLLATQGRTESNIWIATADDLKNSKQITHSSIGAIYGWHGLDWSSDGRIFFVGAKDQSRVIYSMNADGTNIKQITNDGFFDQKPNVSPDGRFVVFQSNRSGTNVIWRVNADGQDLKQLTEGGANSSPTISPDGNRVAYVSGSFGKTSIWRVPSSGGTASLITDRPAMSPRYSPDGKFIACFFTSNANELHKLAIIPAMGGESIRSFPVSQTANLSLEWRQDGQAVYYRDWISGIWKQDTNGGEATKLSELQDDEILPFGWSRDGLQFAFTRGHTDSDVVLIGGDQEKP
jgi:Tol biopolymer transport system component/DNA-binding winged helix-turn-helix (wHTH) protein